MTCKKAEVWDVIMAEILMFPQWSKKSLFKKRKINVSLQAAMQTLP